MEKRCAPVSSSRVSTAKSAGAPVKRAGAAKACSVVGSGAVGDEKMSGRE